MTIAAPLLPLYQVSPGRGRTPAVDAMVMNTPFRLLAEMRHRVPRGQEEALHVDAVDPVELLLGHVEHRLVAVRRAGVVDDDVEVAERRRARSGRARATSASLRHVAGAEPRAAAGRDDLLRDALAARGVDVVDDDLRALVREALGDALAEARAGAGDDGDLVLQSHGAFVMTSLAATAVARIRACPVRYPCCSTTVFSAVKPYSASKPFSRP